ncbi:MAG: competence/damage-inducible protein A [Planctomycetota bacterium]|jgi:nicotinamide-nucleotide amidase
MNSVIVAIGDELTSGQCVDTNSAFLAARLGECGVTTDAHWTIGDDHDQIVDALRRGTQLADVVVVTGGLGPTPDDLTRQALAEVMGVSLELCPQCLADLEAFFRRIGRKVSDANRIQAMLPAGARPLANPVGTAAGIEATLNDTTIYCLPGVPHEMRTMAESHVLPKLSGGRVVAHHLLRTYGLGESDIGATLADLMQPTEDIRVGTTAESGLISVRITALGATSEDAAAKARARGEIVAERLGGIVFGRDDDTLASVAGEALRRSGQTLSTAESCTGGLIGEMITAVSGSSEYYTGGVVAYANEVKQRLLEVPEKLLTEHGAVSEPVAAAMAEGCRRRFGTDWAVSVTGIAGPTGGGPDKPVGLVFTAVAGPKGTTVTRHMFVGPREIVRLRSARSALNELRLAMG